MENIEEVMRRFKLSAEESGSVNLEEKEVARGAGLQAKFSWKGLGEKAGTYWGNQELCKQHVVTGEKSEGGENQWEFVPIYFRKRDGY